MWWQENINYELLHCIFTGSGKTTLLNAVAGRVDVTSGDVTLNGQTFNKQLRRRLGYVIQEDVFMSSLSLYETLYVSYNKALDTSNGLISSMQSIKTQHWSAFYITSTFYTPTRRVDCFLKSPRPSVRPSVRLNFVAIISVQNGWIYLKFCVWLYIDGAYLVSVLSGINSVSLDITIFHCINERENFLHKTHSSQYMDLVKIWFVALYRWGIRCKRFWVLSDVNFLLEWSIPNPTTRVTSCLRKPRTACLLLRKNKTLGKAWRSIRNLS